MTWLLEEHGFKPSENLHWEGLFTCGSGRLHLRGSLSAARPQILVQEIRIRAEQNCEIQIDAGIDARVRTSGYDHFSQVDCQPHDQSIRMQIVTDRDELVQIASRLMLPDITIQQSERLISQRATLSVNKPGAARNPRVRSYRSAPGFCS